MNIINVVCYLNHLYVIHLSKQIDKLGSTVVASYVVLHNLCESYGNSPFRFKL